MYESIEQLVRRNSLNKQLTENNKKIINLERWLFKTYEPNKFGPDDFWERLAQWLDNVPSDSEKQLLIQLLLEVLYLGPVEFEELYRLAYQGPIARWLIDICQIDVFAPDGQQKLATVAGKTWFCPLTDSLHISTFFHLNNVASGSNFRPDWHSVKKFGDIERIKEYCTKNDIKRLVLIEDFVGSGSQTLSSVRFAATELPDLQVLFVPLVICPKGGEMARQLEAELCEKRAGALRFEATMELSNDSFLTLHRSPYVEPNSYINALRNLIISTYSKVSGGLLPTPKNAPYDPFGYPHGDPTGGLVVMHSNTPNNTLPLIHWCPPERTWHPIFPRHNRM